MKWDFTNVIFFDLLFFLIGIFLINIQHALLSLNLRMLKFKREILVAYVLTILHVKCLFISYSIFYLMQNLRSSSSQYEVVWKFICDWSIVMVTVNQFLSISIVLLIRLNASSIIRLKSNETKETLSLSSPHKLSTKCKRLVPCVWVSNLHRHSELRQRPNQNDRAHFQERGDYWCLVQGTVKCLDSNQSLKLQPMQLDSSSG